MEYSEKNEHLNDDPLENTKNSKQSPDDPSENTSASGPLNTGQDDSVEKKAATENKPSTDKPAEDTPPEVTGSTDTNEMPGKQDDVKSAEVSEEEKVGKPETPAAENDEETEENQEETAGNDKETAGKDSQVNYELLSKPDLVKMLDDLIRNRPFGELRSEVDEIETVYNRKVEEEMQEKKERFLAEGGPEQDFKPAGDPVDKQMSELLERYRALKADFSKQMEEEKETNLAAKNEILEEFRLLMEGQEGFDKTFRKFKQLQKRWFEIGIVPKQKVKDLWNSYNFFVEKFNDYVKINRELRELDLNKNYDQKVLLCEKAEQLTGEKDISTAFRTLQKYHSQWREIGPVPREHKDALWERFKAATSLINKAHQEFQSDLKESLVENLEKKKVLCEKAENLADLELNKHNDWVVKTNELLAIQKEWKTIGYAPKKDNNKIYARFRQACDRFFDKKAKFYAETFEQQQEHMEEKKKIIEAAEELKDSTDWKNTTDKLIELQKKWKEVGPVPRKESDKLWKRFRSACDHFFNKKAEFFSGKNESYEDNLKEKEALISEMQEFKYSGDESELLETLEEFQRRYNEIGFVPVEVKDKIRNDFKAAINAVIDRTGLDEDEKSLFRYRIRITAILNSPRSENKIRFERDKMVNKLQQLKNDIGVWENNIGFFKETESAEDTISEFNEKIEDARNRISLLENKIRTIDELEDEI